MIWSNLSYIISAMDADNLQKIAQRNIFFESIWHWMALIIIICSNGSLMPVSAVTYQLVTYHNGIMYQKYFEEDRITNYSKQINVKYFYLDGENIPTILMKISGLRQRLSLRVISRLSYMIFFCIALYMRQTSCYHIIRGWPISLEYIDDCIYIHLHIFPDYHVKK